MYFPDVHIIINLVSFAVITGIVKTTITLAFNICSDLMCIITSKILGRPRTIISFHVIKPEGNLKFQ